MKTLREILSEGVFSNLKQLDEGIFGDNITNDVGPITSMDIIEKYIVGDILKKYHIQKFNDPNKAPNEDKEIVLARDYRDDDFFNTHIYYYPDGVDLSPMMIYLGFSFEIQEKPVEKDKDSSLRNFIYKPVCTMDQITIASGQSELLSTYVYNMSWNTGAKYPNKLKDLQPWLGLSQNKCIITYENLEKIKKYYDDLVGRFIDCVKSNRQGIIDDFNTDNKRVETVAKFRREIKKVI